MKLNVKITRLKFTAILVALLIVFVLILNIKATSSTLLILALVILFVGLIPFIIGFVLQMVLWRANIPSYILWILSTLIMAYTMYFSSNPKAIFFPDIVEEYTIYKVMVFIASIIIYVGFMQSGVEFSQKIRKRIQHNKTNHST
jgi:hypothetical protein